MDGDTRNRLETDYRRVLVEEMFPALRRLATFVRNDYLLTARTTDGIGAFALILVAVIAGFSVCETPADILLLKLESPL